MALAQANFRTLPSMATREPILWATSLVNTNSAKVEASRFRIWNPGDWQDHLDRGVSADKAREGAAGARSQHSSGKDTTSGHWEMAGLVVKSRFVTFPNGFPREIVERWVRENNLPGVLGNKAASGTEIIAELGEEHVKTGKPILYTSADSVWQVAAHEQAFGLEKALQDLPNQPEKSATSFKSAA